MRTEGVDELLLCIGLISFVITWPVVVLLARVTATSVIAGCDESTASEAEQTCLQVELEMCALGRNIVGLKVTVKG